MLAVLSSARCGLSSAAQKPTHLRKNQLTPSPGLALEISTSLYPQHFLVLASTGNFAKALAKGMGECSGSAGVHLWGAVPCPLAAL